MNRIPKSTLSAALLLTTGLLHPASGSSASESKLSFGGELSSAAIAEQIAKDDGYRFYHFTPETKEPYQLIVRSRDSQQELQLPSLKKCVIAVRIGSKNAPEAVRVYYTSSAAPGGGDLLRGAVSMVFPHRFFPGEFSPNFTESEVALGEPFLIITGTTGKIEFILKPQKG